MLTPPTWRRIAWLGTIVVVVLCYVPPPDVQGPDLPHGDKLAHLLAFAGIGLAWRLSGMGWRRVLLLGVALIALTEIGQAVLPTGRSADWMDALGDAAGVVLGLLVADRCRSWAVRTATA